MREDDSREKALKSRVVRRKSCGWFRLCSSQSSVYSYSTVLKIDLGRESISLREEQSRNRNLVSREFECVGKPCLAAKPLFPARELLNSSLHSLCYRSPVTVRIQGTCQSSRSSRTERRTPNVDRERKPEISLECAPDSLIPKLPD